MDTKHLIFILDGFGYNAWNTVLENGLFGYMRYNSKVIAPYPSMTDLCLNDMLGDGKCLGIESCYYDPIQQKKTSGLLTQYYQKNLPVLGKMDYKAPIYWDIPSYLIPKTLFAKELKNAKNKILASNKNKFIAYFISSAGISTKYGLDGQLEALDRLNKLCDELRQEAVLRITILADHGHAYVPPKPINFKKNLIKKGWKWTKSLTGDQGVVALHYGMVLYGGFMTMRKGKLADDLLAIDGVKFVSFKEDGKVTVKNNNGMTKISKYNNGYKYETISGSDPLGYSSILKPMNTNADGCYDEKELLLTSASHEYPDALDRIWRAHNDLVQHPADVIAELDNEWAGGTGLLMGFTKILSTHGSLNKINSTTFIADSHQNPGDILRTRELFTFLNS